MENVDCVFINELCIIFLKEVDGIFINIVDIGLEEVAGFVCINVFNIEFGEVDFIFFNVVEIRLGEVVGCVFIDVVKIEFMK